MMMLSDTDDGGMKGRDHWRFHQWDRSDLGFIALSQSRSA
jgi:hypothetical protein